MNNPIFVDKNKIHLVGMNFYGDPFSNASGWSEENEIGRLCKRFSTFLLKNPGSIKNIKKENVSFEVWINTDLTEEKGYFEIFTGVLVDKFEDVPLECSMKTLPETTYAIFTLKGKEITSDWPTRIYKEYLPKSEYKPSLNYNIQYYDKRFKGIDKINDSEIDVYIPVKNG